jgi:hypothetical protein
MNAAGRETGMVHERFRRLNTKGHWPNQAIGTGSGLAMADLPVELDVDIVIPG